MSIHELIGDYSWLVKRVAAVSPAENVSAKAPSRHPLAWVIAAFIPRMNIMSLVILYIIIIAAAGVMGALDQSEEYYEDEYGYYEEQYQEPQIQNQMQNNDITAYPSYE